ncbi:MAG: hypothetical protein MJ056_04410 [Akkermansia sp.]|nr:hypothetical protein [Akkermansia sp.]
MGFTKPKAAPATATPIPVVTDNEPAATKAAYNQTAARRRGLLSTLLSRRPAADPNSTAADSGNTTLG